MLFLIILGLMHFTSKIGRVGTNTNPSGILSLHYRFDWIGVIMKVNS